MIHDFAQLHGRHTDVSSRTIKFRSVLVIAGLLLVSVGVKHMVQNADAELAKNPSTMSALDAAPAAVQTKPQPVVSQAENHPTEPAASLEPEAPKSLLKKIVGQANGAGFEFYDMLKHAWPKANEMMTEVKDSQMNDQAAFLQVASYQEIDEAEKLRKKLVSMGLDVTVETGGSDSGALFYRVFVGPFTTDAKRKKAEIVLTKMSLSPVTSNR